MRKSFKEYMTMLRELVMEHGGRIDFAPMREDGRRVLEHACMFDYEFDDTGYEYSVDVLSLTVQGESLMAECITYRAEADRPETAAPSWVRERRIGHCDVRALETLYRSAGISIREMKENKLL